jgi:hypothetical protein
VAGSTTAWLGAAPASAEILYRETREFTHVRGGQPFTCEVEGTAFITYRNGVSDIDVRTAVEDANTGPCAPFGIRVSARYRVSGDDQVRNFSGGSEGGTGASAQVIVDGEVIDLDVEHTVTWFCDGPGAPSLCTSSFTVNAK